MNGYIIALDQGTTSSRSIIFDSKGNIVSLAQYPFTQIYPKPGWVEHDADEIWSTMCEVMKGALEKSGLEASDIAAIGITNQRETTIVWDKETGRPIYNAIVWQCRRTADRIEKLKKDGLEDLVRDRTGLISDAYFSGSKIAWILDHVEGARERAKRGELLFGTVDTWLIWNLTNGKVHVTDYSNACRTMLFDISRRHGVHLEQEPSYGGREYLEKQDYILMKQKEKLAAQEQKLEELTLKIEDVETLLDDVSDAAYDKAVEVVADAVRLETHKEDIRLVEESKKWVLSPERKAPQKEREYAAARLDGVIGKIKNTMQTAFAKIQKALMQPETKRAGKERIKEKARESIREQLKKAQEEMERREDMRRRPERKKPDMER